MKYILDANVLIEAKNRYYGFDICPGFWNWLDQQFAAGTIVSTVAIRDELLEHGDDLTEWAKSRSDFFPVLDADSLPHLQTLAVWVRAQQYRAAAVTEFLSSADYQLIATAMGNGYTMVTHEVPSDSVKRVKIPEPCMAHGVPVISPFVMLRRLGARFDLRTP